jgi:hypothetical protein
MSEETTVAAKRIPLSKTRTYTTRVDLGLWERDSDAGWSTSDGYAVHRVYDRFGNAEYWARNRAGRFSLQDDFAGARKAIDWLRERGR